RSWHLSTCSATNGLSTCNGRRRTWRRWGSPRCRGVNTWRGYRRCAPARYRPSGPARLRTGPIATLVVFELHAELQPHITVAQIHLTHADGAHRCGNPMELRVDVIARNLLDLSQINEYAVQQLIGRSHDRLKCLSIAQCLSVRELAGKVLVRRPDGHVAAGAAALVFSRASTGCLGDPLGCVMRVLPG